MFSVTFYRNCQQTMGWLDAFCGIHDPTRNSSWDGDTVPAATAVLHGQDFAPQLLGWPGLVLQRKHVLISPASLSCLQLFSHRE